MDDSTFLFMLIFYVIVSIVSKFASKKEEPIENYQPINFDTFDENFKPTKRLKSKSNSNSKSNLEYINDIEHKFIEQPKINQADYLNFTSDDAMNAIVLSEIFGKPKSRR